MANAPGSIPRNPAGFFAIPVSGLKIDGCNVVRLSEELFVIVIYDGRNIRVVHDLCPHMGGPLSQGVSGKQKDLIVCPWHGYRFSKKTLALENNPNEATWIEPLAGEAADKFQTPPLHLREIPFRVDDGNILIDASTK